MIKIRIAFVCTGNSCRSQMAEGWARSLGGDIFDVYSTGTHPAEAVNPAAIQVMLEAGLDISAQKPKLIEDIPPEMDILITMGCGVECPYLPANHREDWGLEDPAGKPVEEFRRTRDMIRDKMLDLIDRVKKGISDV